jgi:hypothetical protein
MPEAFADGGVNEEAGRIDGSFGVGVADPFRQHSFNTCERGLRGFGELGIGPTFDDARTGAECGEFLFGEHQRREFETGVETVANACFAVDGTPEAMRSLMSR